MIGAMQNWPLAVWRLVDHAANAHASQEIVSARCEGDIHRTTWGEVRGRSQRLAQALARLGVKRGDRVGTLAWNGYRHLEGWFAISGMGAVTHTINPRLFPDQIAWIMNHADDRVLLFDITFLTLVEELAPRLAKVGHFVLMAGRDSMPKATSLPNLLCYEDLISREDGNHSWVDVDEQEPAGLCYTSGTTGDPKGVLYSHRSTVLHSWAITMPDSMGISSTSSIMPVVPMFHANAWGIPYGAAMTGAKLVLNGPLFDAPSLHKLLVQEGVTITAAVPTVWQAMLGHLNDTQQDLGALAKVVIGGASASRFMIDSLQSRYGVEVRHIWGMTELSPLGSIGTLHPAALALSVEERLDLQCKQGRSVFGVEMEICDGDGRPLEHNGKVAGSLKVRGPWVVESYFQSDVSACDADGWFDTGDVATIDPLGYMQITDRAKDVIKSGGEWISSLELENLVLLHPGVASAAAIGVPHPKWDERPVLIIERRSGETVDAAGVLDFLKDRIAKWWTPDAIVFVDGMPLGSTGKINKRELREAYRDILLSS